MKKNERTFGENTKRFFEPILGERKVLVLATIRATNWGIGGIIHIVFLQMLTFYLESNQESSFFFTLYCYIAYLIIFVCIELLVRGNGWVRIPQTVEKNVIKEYIKKFIRLENTSIEKYGTGKMIAIMSHGIDKWGHLISVLLEEGTIIVVRIFFAFVVLYYQSVYYIPLFIIILILSQINGVYFNSLAIKYRNKRRDVRNDYIAHLVKILMSKFEILQTDKYKQEITHLHKYADKQIYYNTKYDPFLIFLFQVPFLLLMTITLGSIYFIGKGVFAGTFLLSDFVGIVGMLILIRATIENSIRLFKNVTKEFNEITKLWDFFDNTPNIKGYESGKEFEYKKGKIEIEKLSFGYTKKQKVFDNFSLNIAGAKVTALVGNSGSGKSTLVKLISGYIRQDSGKIKVDGQNLEKVSLKSYYKNIGYLTQEPSVFDGTIRDNLTYAVDRTLKLGELEKVIKQAKCEFIYDLENGLETEIGEKGIRLSGGQRQRLAIAKIFLKNPKIIILDEPTSALDSFSEEQITKAMHNLFKGRTVIIIAHRLQTVKNADKILVLEDGKVIEEGNHKQLVKQKGIYKKMLDLQSGF